MNFNIGQILKLEFSKYKWELKDIKAFNTSTFYIWLEIKEIFEEQGKGCYIYFVSPPPFLPYRVRLESIDKKKIISINFNINGLKIDKNRNSYDDSFKDSLNTFGDNVNKSIENKVIKGYADVLVFLDNCTPYAIEKEVQVSIN